MIREEELILEGSLAIIFGKKRAQRHKIQLLKKETLLLIKDVKSLDKRELHIIKQRLGNNTTLKEIGNSFGGISRERVRQLEVRAGKKLKIYFEQMNIKKVLSFDIK